MSSLLVPGQVASAATAGATTKTATFTNTPIQGNILIAVVFRTNGEVPTVAGFTLIRSTGGGGVAAAGIYYKIAGVAESKNVVASASFGYIGLVIYEFIVSDFTPGLINSNTNSGSTLSATPGAVTVNGSSSLVIVGLGANNALGSSSGWSSPFISTTPDSTRGWIGYALNPPRSSINPSVSFATMAGSGWGAVIVDIDVAAQHWGRRL